MGKVTHKKKRLGQSQYEYRDYLVYKGYYQMWKANFLLEKTDIIGATMKHVLKQIDEALDGKSLKPSKKSRPRRK